MMGGKKMRYGFKKLTSILLSFVMVLSLVATIPAKKAEAAATPTVKYKVHRQTYGWENDWKTNGATSGTMGEGKRLESIKIDIEGANMGVNYKTHIQSYGWESAWRVDEQLSGTEGQAKRLEAIQIKLTGPDAGKWDIYYRVHAQTYGWLGWAKNGESAGTAGQGKRLEAIQIVVVPKGSYPSDVGAQGSMACPFVDIGKKPSTDGTGAVSYMTHVQSYGDQKWVSDGSISGTSGEAKRLEQIRIKVDSSKLGYVSGGIEYQTHVQSYGWMGWMKNGQPSGTSGQGKRLEAIRIRLTGSLASYYDIYYRVHAQSYGWLGWAKNGEASGTAGYGKRLEAIQVTIVPKGTAAPNYLPAQAGMKGYVSATAGDTGVINGVKVLDRYCLVRADNSYSIPREFCYHIPSIYVGNSNRDLTVNDTMYNELYNVLQEEKVISGNYWYLSCMHYMWGQKNNIVSVVTLVKPMEYEYYDYTIYNVDVKNDTFISDERLIQMYGLTEDEFYDKLADEVEEYFDESGYWINGGSQYFDECEQDTLEYENLMTAQPYINSNGDLCAVLLTYLPVGGGEYYYLYNITGTTKPQQPDCKMGH